jgi:hypothetical protein
VCVSLSYIYIQTYTHTTHTIRLLSIISSQQISQFVILSNMPSLFNVRKKQWNIFAFYYLLFITLYSLKKKCPTDFKTKQKSPEPMPSFKKLANM